MDHMSYPISTMMNDTYTIDAGGTTGFGNYTITADYTAPPVTLSNEGIAVAPQADIRIGEHSLKQFMQQVEERLNILRPNLELESRWDQLAQLGQQYRKLEAELVEQEKMWNILKDPE